MKKTYVSPIVMVSEFESEEILLNFSSDTKAAGGNVLVGERDDYDDDDSEDLW